MVFSSLVFLCVFLPAVFLLHQIIPSMPGKNALLVIASLLFYAYGEPVYVVLMIVSTIVNWAFGVLIGRAKTPRSRKALTGCTVAANLAFLAVFKYAGMVVTTLNSLLGASVPLPDIALPIGISFYTFQAMSYVIDVYRGDVEAQHNYGKVLLYIAFFPQLIAGPIVKYHDVAPQLSERHASLADIAAGFRRFCVGLGKKVLIANVMAIAVDSVFAAPLETINVTAAWIAALAYLLQIYFDFSGYSDMAIGMAQMFGFHYKENFNYPYASTSVKEFWRRWHISLSTWFREYLYFPLGGNRKGRGRTVANKMCVFLLCGLWHGASWTFVVWGLIHGLLLMTEEYIPIHKLPKPIGWVYTLLAVTFAFVLFRADSFAQGGTIIAQMICGWHFEHACMALTMKQLTPLFIATFVIAVPAALPIRIAIQKRLANAPANLVIALEVASYALALCLLGACMLDLSGGSYNPFIYFRF